MAFDLYHLVLTTNEAGSRGRQVVRANVGRFLFWRDGGMDRHQCADSNLLTKPLGSCADLCIQLTCEGFHESAVLGEGFSPPLREGVQSHEPSVHLFVGGLLQERPLQQLDALLVLPTSLVHSSQLEVQREQGVPQLLAPTLRPLLIAVSG